MYRRHGEKLQWVLVAGDPLGTAAAWLAAAAWAERLGQGPAGGVSGWWTLAVLVATPLVHQACGLYDIHRLVELPREWRGQLKAAVLLALVASAVGTWCFPGTDGRAVTAWFVLFQTLFQGLARRLLWGVLSYGRRHGLNHGKALIVGGSRPGRRAARILRDHRWTGLEVVGCVDRRPPVPVVGLPHLGNLEDLRALITKHDIDHVVVALSAPRYGELPRIYRELSGLPVEVLLVPDLPQLAGMRIRMEEIDQTPFLALREAPETLFGLALKRGIDVVGACVALVLFAPVMAGAAIAVRRSGPGPILYRQPRAGLGGRPFDMLKFRTMRTDAEAGGAVWARSDDDRCTPVGRFLRRWSLDELPQLFNVLAGDMSLVGPRPERPIFVEQFSRDLPAYPWRHRMKAGMTGWAQVHGWRGNTSLRRRLEFDLYYVNHWSPWLDLRILASTLWSGFRHKNAY